MAERHSEDDELLESALAGLETETQQLFSELAGRLEEKPRRVLMLIAAGPVSNNALATALDCAPTSIVRYRRAIRRKLEELAGEQTD